MSVEEDKEYVLRTCKDQDIKFIWLWFTDILGSLKSFAITVEELEAARRGHGLRRLVGGGLRPHR
jgi:glutamine synthetase